MPIPLTLRLVKGSKLTFGELDQNFINLRNAINAITPTSFLGATLNGNPFSSPKQIIEINETLNIPLNFEYNVTTLTIDGNVIMDGDLNII